MTLKTFMNRVPWVEMTVRNNGMIRHRYAPMLLCPIDCAGGFWNSPARDGDLGLSQRDRMDIIDAADERCLTPLRLEMLRRIRKARQEVV